MEFIRVQGHMSGRLSSFAYRNPVKNQVEGNQGLFSRWLEIAIKAIRVR
jgi:hypothetical protein